MDGTPDKMCTICFKESCKYTCPRCNIPYCSVDCYRSEKHMGCSEAFYRDCFMEGLKDQSASDKERKAVMEMLSRVDQETAAPDSDDDELELAERLEGVDLDRDPAKVWSRMTETEKAEFEKLLNAGKLQTLVETWTPWWTVKNTNLVRDLEQEAEHHRDRPPCATIPDIRKLLKKSRPSADIRYNMVNVLYAYAFVARLHNGEHLSFCLDSTQEVLEISEVLGKNVVCSSASESVHFGLCVLQKHKRLSSSSSDLRLSSIQSVIDIIEGPCQGASLDFVMAALSDLLRLFQKSHKKLSRGLKRGTADNKIEDTRELKKKIFQAEKKLEFLLGWTQRFGMAMYTILPEMKLEQCAVLTDEESVKITKEKFEEEWGGKTKPLPKTLIEEIT